MVLLGSSHWRYSHLRVNGFLILFYASRVSFRKVHISKMIVLSDLISELSLTVLETINNPTDRGVEILLAASCYRNRATEIAKAPAAMSQS